MAGLLICGLGPGNIEQITGETLQLLIGRQPVYLRTAVHPAAVDLQQRGFHFTAFDDLYESEPCFEKVYKRIVDELMAAGKKETVVYAVPGHPMCGEATVQGLIKACRSENLPYRIFPAVSFIDACMTAVEIDPVDGLTVLDALTLKDHSFSVRNALLITQVYSRYIAGEVKLILGHHYSDETSVALITADPENGEEKVLWRQLYQIDRDDACNHLTTLFIPPQEKNYRDISALTDIMTILRAPEGCPWDRAQTHESLKTYLLEETYEALDAIDRQDIDNLIEELGDLLYQIVFHAEIGREKGYFDFGDVVEGICKKMLRRHPHVFGNQKIESENALNVMWDQIKQEEKKDRRKDPNKLFDIPTTFSALMRGTKMYKKAERGGYRTDEEAPLQKIRFCLEHLTESEDGAERTTLVGALLFAVCHYAAENDIDAELALKQASDAFEQNAASILRERRSKCE